MTRPGSFFFISAADIGVVGRVEVISIDQVYCCGNLVVQVQLDDGRSFHVCQSALFPYKDGMVEQIGTA